MLILWYYSETIFDSRYIMQFSQFNSSVATSVHYNNNTSTVMENAPEHNYQSKQNQLATLTLF